MASHPSQVLVDIVGITKPGSGRSCEEHAICGSLLKHDTLVRFRAVQINVEGKEETALAVYWVMDGLDRCRVGFLPRHLIKHKEDYDGKLAQVVDLLEESASPSDRAKSKRNYGVCRAVIVEAEGPKEEANTFALELHDMEKRTLEREKTPKKKKSRANSDK